MHDIVVFVGHIGNHDAHSGSRLIGKSRIGSLEFRQVDADLLGNVIQILAWLHNVGLAVEIRHSHIEMLHDHGILFPLGLFHNWFGLDLNRLGSFHNRFGFSRCGLRLILGGRLGGTNRDTYHMTRFQSILDLRIQPFNFTHGNIVKL